MISDKALVKQYRQLSEIERAALMVTASMNDDSRELQRLKASAEIKQFSITADKEAEICTAWETVHKDYLVVRGHLNSQFLNIYIQFFAEPDVPNKKAGGHHSRECLAEIQALDIAFIDTLEGAGLPLNEELVEGFGFQPQETHKQTDPHSGDDLRISEWYSNYSTLFKQELWPIYG